MRRETAYKLAGRRHGHRGVQVTGLQKRREIRFRSFPEGQAQRALNALAALPGIQVEFAPRPDGVVVHYSVVDYSLELLEEALLKAGFFLESSLYNKLVRAIVYYCEETQRHNLLSPERLLKQSNEVYIQVYGHHLHGDHDETPLELREYK